MLGTADYRIIDRNDSQAIQSTYWGLYVHDNWRATPKLTLDLGVRWEYQGPVTERFDRSVRGFDPNAAQPIAPKVLANYAANPDPALPPSQLQVKGGLLFAGVGDASDFCGIVRSKFRAANRVRLQGPAARCGSGRLRYILHASRTAGAESSDSDRLQPGDEPGPVAEQRADLRSKS